MRSPTAALAALLPEGSTAAHGDHLRVSGLRAAEIGEVAAAAGIALDELTHVQPSLEAAYMELTKDAARSSRGGTTSHDRDT